ncbi:cobalt-precorrin-6X reductase [Aureimonas ureilytica]|uniref:Cobalt-precorrin-6X reductase n=1 Tax=Aureimonas ureilytica TaxID=401562 RepID=A0A175RLA5_9HYPH|nr:cobalt-precorrin-6A reductase [Aureimonas ureilytica]KTR03764.1 cobalt-precorrin-6X reductase [Aureimonas ureilytica]
MEEAPFVLLLGGTAEASVLARRLRTTRPDIQLLLSLAGRTKAPALPDGVETRIGGFGGAAGLARFMREHGVTRLLDTTHPYAVGMSRNAGEAARLAGIPRATFLRAPWEPVDGDRWQEVACLRTARDALPSGARPFLALGSQHIAPFRHRPDLCPVLRQVDAPAEPLPFAATLVTGKPSQDVAEEAELFREHGITHLVCRNSGGARGYAKIAAARNLQLPVILIQRPPEPDGPILRDLDAALSWLTSPS